MVLKVTSTAFEDGAMIPPEYTADGRNISPPLRWESIPKEAKSIAIINDDPDAPMGTWVHWVVYCIPPDKTGLEEDIKPEPVLADGTKQGKNDFAKIGYGGPAPPGGTHRYFFKVYVLDIMPALAAGADKATLEKAMKDHILAQGQLLGKYKRK